MFGNSIASGSITFAYCAPTAIIVVQLFEVRVRILFVRSALVPSVTTLSKVKEYWLCAFLTPARVASLYERSPSPPVSYAIQMFPAALACGAANKDRATAAIAIDARNFIRGPSLDSYKSEPKSRLLRRALYLLHREAP